MEKAVFLLHGFLSDQNDFQPLLSFLEQNYDHVERITYPGHGIGENYLDFNWEKTIQQVEESFERLYLKYQIIDVIGYSMGGAIAVYLSKKYTFRKLILLAPANKYLNLLIPFSKLKHIIVNFYEIQKAFILRKEEDKELYKERIKSVLEDDLYSIKFLKEKYLKLYFHHAYINFRSIIQKSNEDLNNINNPCFIAWGKLDQLVPKESVMHLYNISTNVDKHLEIYDDLSHLLLLSQSNKKLIEDVENFILK